ncbi:MAG: S-layer homology domain-containing protein [Oscillospiraceae bacterium]|nr:S-layer homology domain-containing protein [Oscillospiraceae bacterium]
MPIPTTEPTTMIDLITESTTTSESTSEQTPIHSSRNRNDRYAPNVIIPRSTPSTEPQVTAIDDAGQPLGGPDRIPLGAPSSNVGIRTFTDVGDAHWAYNYIKTLANYGIIEGYSQQDGTFMFKPETEIKRAEIIKLVAAALELPLDTNFDGSIFADWEMVADWARPYIGAMVSFEVVQGSLEDGLLYVKADNNVTRQEMVALVVRALATARALETVGVLETVNDFGEDSVIDTELDTVRDLRSGAVNDSGLEAKRDSESDIVKHFEIDDTEGSEGYILLHPVTDMEEASEWAVKDLVFAINNEMINISNDAVKPIANAKRSEAAMMLYRLLELIS